MPSRHVQLLACVAGTLLCADNALAQVLNSKVGDNPLQSNAKRLKGKSAAAIGGALGYTVAPGIVITPSLYLEGGHDDNPDEIDGRDRTGYGRTGGRITITKIRPKSAGRLALFGSALRLSDNRFRTDRWDGGASGDVVFSVAPGLSVSAGGLIKRDEIDLIKELNKGAYAEVGYRNQTITSFVRGRHQEIEYLNSIAPAASVPVNLRPFFATSAFDANRDEISAGLLYGNTNWLAPYVEVSAARVNYRNQPNQAVIDRDADDFFAKAGIRVTLSPYFQTDLGWRWNTRDTEDPTTGQFDSDYFDASVSWRPWPFFVLTATFDREIGEPSGAFSVLADIKSYTVSVDYRLTSNTALSMFGRRKQIAEIGGNALYRRREIGAELSRDVAPWVQIYGGLSYEFIEEDNSDIGYDRLKFGVGTRIVLGDHIGKVVSTDPKDPVSLSPEDAHRWNLPPTGVIESSTGYAWFQLPKTEMTTLVGGAFFDQATGRAVDHDGRLSGFSSRHQLRDFAEHQFANGLWLSFSAAAYYSYVSSTQNTACDFSASSDCVFVNIVDFDPTRENNTGAFGRLRTAVDRWAHYWGADLDARPGRRHTRVSLKDEHTSTVKLPIRVGVSVRQINQGTRLHAIDISVPDPIDYREDLVATYYGGYVGLEHTWNLKNGYSINVSGQAGVYYAHADFESRYLAYIPIGGTTFVVEQGALDGADETTAFIGSLRVDLNKHLSWGKVSVYGEGQYLSHVPYVNTNNDDQAGGSPFGVVGTQRGTRIDYDDAFGWTAGIRVHMPFDSLR